MTRRTNEKIGKHRASVGMMPGSRMGEWGNAPNPMGSSEKCPAGTIRDPKTGKCVGLVQGPLTDDIKAKNGPYGPAGEPKPKLPHPAPGSKLPPNMPPGPAKPGSKHPAPKPKRPKRGLRSVKRGGRRSYSGKGGSYISPSGVCRSGYKTIETAFQAAICEPITHLKAKKAPKITASAKKKPSRKRRRTRI